MNNAEYTYNIKNPSNDNLAKKKLSQYFRNRFTNVNNWLKAKKTELNKTESYIRKRNLGGSLLARDIQKMEAELWIHELLKTLPENLIYITVHDSIIIFNHTIEQVNFAIEKIKELGKGLYDIEIPLSIEFQA